MSPAEPGGGSLSEIKPPSDQQPSLRWPDRQGAPGWVTLVSGVMVTCGRGQSLPFSSPSRLVRGRRRSVIQPSGHSAP